MASLKVTPGNGAATVLWDTRASADDYVVRVSTSPDDVGEQFTTASPPFVADDLANGTVYYISVAGRNSLGEGPARSTDVIPFAPPPGWSQQLMVNNEYCSSDQRNCAQRALVGLRNVDINRDGVAAVAWFQQSLSNNSYEAMVSFTSNGDWHEPVSLWPVGGKNATVAVAPNGDVHVLYSTQEILRYPECIWPGLNRTLVWRRYSGGEWSEPVEIQNADVEHALHLPLLTSDSHGNVFAVWFESDVEPGCNGFSYTTYNVWSRRFDATDGRWGDAIELSQSPKNVRPARIATTDNGQAVVAWIQDTRPFDHDLPDGGARQRAVYVARFDGLTWQPAEIVGRNDHVDYDSAEYFALDATDDGFVAVSWNHTFATTPTVLDRSEVGAARFDPDLMQWSAPEVVRATEAGFGEVGIAAGPGGRVNVVWWEYDSSDSITTSNMDPVVGVWDTPEGLVARSNSLENRFGFEADGTGRVYLAWASHPDPTGIFVNTMDSTSGSWSDPILIGPRQTGNSQIMFKMHKSGHGIIVDETEPDRIYAIIHSPGD